MATSRAAGTANSNWSALERGAFAATAISIVGLLASIVGRVVEAKGFSGRDNDTSTISNIFFGVTVLGLAAAVVTGAAAWWAGRRTGRRNATIVGGIVAGYLILAAVVAAALN